MECDTAVHAALDAVAMPVFMVNLTTDALLYANRAAREIFDNPTALNPGLLPDDYERWQTWRRQPDQSPFEARWQTMTDQQWWRCTAQPYTLAETSVHLLTLTPLDAEKHLRDHNTLLENILNTLPDEIYVKDREQRFTFINAAGIAGAGHTNADQILGKNDLELFGEKTRMFYDSEQHLLATGEPIRNDDYVIDDYQHPQERRRLIITKVPFHDDTGRIMGLVGVNRNMTTWERALRDSEARYRAISEITSDYMFSVIFTRTGEAVYEWITETAYERITGYQFAEIRDQVARGILYHPDDWERVQSDLVTMLATRQTVASDYRIIRKDGVMRWLHVQRNPIWDEHEQRIVRYYAAARDITEQQQAAEALHESEQRYRIISEMTSDYMFAVRVEPDGTRITEWMTENAYERITGYQFAEIRDQLIGGILYHPDDWERVQSDLAKMLATRQTIASDYRIIRKDGVVRWLHIQRNPIWDEHEQRIIRYYAAARDITEQQQAAQALRENEQRYRMISEMTSDYMFAVRVEPDGTRITEWMTESSFERITGYAYKEIEPQLKDGVLFHPDEWERVLGDTYRMIATGQSFGAEYRTLRRDGALRWVYIQRIPILDNDGRLIRYYAATRDITQQKEAEIALRESEQRYRIISEIASDYAFSFALEPDGTLRREWMMEEAFTRMTGYSIHEFQEDSDQSLYHPDDQDKARLDLAMTLQGIVTTNEYRIITRQQEERWVRMYRQPRWNADETQVVGFYAVVQDINDQKRAEAIAQQELELRNLLKHEQDMGQTKSRIMTLIAHEFRTPLTIVSTSAQVLERYRERLPPEKQVHHLHQIQRQVLHLTDLLEDVALVIQGQMRQFTPRWEQVDMIALCRDMLDQFALNLAADHRLVFDTQGDPQSLTADRRLMQYILRNLISNAIKYSQVGSEVQLQLLYEADACLILVQDKGMGIAPEDQPHIFTPFYRSQKAGDVSGLGLGLSVVKDAVELHRGMVTVESKPGVGSTFKIRLPLETPAHA